MKLLYNFPYVCVSCSNGIIVFLVRRRNIRQCQGSKRGKETLACGSKVHGVGEVVLVSKTHIYSLNLLPLSGTVWLYGDNHSICPMLCSNYDKEYHKQCLYVPTDSSLDPEEHPYGAEDTWPLPS